MPTEISSLLIIAAKSIAVYVFILLAIRLFGKKELAQLSVIDLVFILLISNSVQNAMVGSDSSLVGGLSAAAALFLVNYILKLIDYKFPLFSKAVQGESIMLVYEGKVLKEHLEKAMITEEELEAAVREHGVKSINEVTLAVLEVDGNISVVSDEFKTKTQRKHKMHKSLINQN
ncbi:MAG TPA: YetF domain-containing protein [Chitinophagales bacterium]